MQLKDIHQELTERPGGFGGIMKQKLKRQLSPFARGTQRKAKGAEALLKTARVVKSALQDWMNKAFRSSGGEKAPLTMEQFLLWVKKAQPKYSEGIIAYARGNSDYAEYFRKEPGGMGGAQQTSKPEPDQEKTGKHEVPGDGDNLELEKDPKEPTDKQKEDNETRKVYKKMGDDLEAEEKEKEKSGKQDIKASKGNDKEPKVDTSASIYEARLRALLEADEEVDADKDEDVSTKEPKHLEDNQIDTLITMGIEKQIELNGGQSIVDEPGEVMSGGSSDESDFSGGGASDDFLSEYQNELETVLTKVVKGDELDKRDQRNARAMLNSI